MATPVLVHQDTAPVISAVLTDDSTALPLDLTNATAVYFQVRLLTERRFLINGLCTIDGDPTTGAVTYALAADDLDFSGECSARFLILWDDDTRQHTTPAISLTVEAE